VSGELDGKVAVVTGGGGGIGEAVARLFAAEGCRVVVAGRRPAPIERVAGDIAGLAVTADVGREDAVAALFRACDDAFGRLDILVNNAGMVPPRAGVEDQDMAPWDDTFAVNVRGVILCIKHAAPMLKRQGGAIVNMASRVALHGCPGQIPYSASKFAVLGITQSVAQELGPFGVRVNALCPSATLTAEQRRRLTERARDQGRTVDEQMEIEILSAGALHRAIMPEDVANASLFFSSDRAGAITGQHLVIDAGRL
jgi:NAD(P)-dependent dehydrogenase (short-subunit alcohol dehydrogenase family)